MADFNPAPQPTYEPNWMFFSRQDRENPRPNDSSQILSEGAGHIFEGGIKLADQLQEQNVKHQVFDVEQNEREGFISAANTLQQQQAGAQANNQPGPLNILTGDPVKAAPAPVQAAIADVSKTNNAYAQGKVDEKYYYQRVIPQLQAIRQQYPGYRDVVDQALGNTANAYMRTLVSELNEQRANAKSEHNQLVTEAMNWGREGYFGAHPEIVVQGVMNGQIDRATLMKAAGPMIQQNLQMKALQLQNLQRETNDKTLADGAKSYAQTNAAFQFGTGVTWPSVMARTGMQTGGQSPQDHVNAIIYAQQHPETINQNQLMAHAMAADSYVNQSFSAYMTAMNKPIQGDPQHRSWATILGPEQTQAIWNEQAAPYKNIIASFGDPKTYALADATANIIKNVGQGDTLAAIQDPKSGPVIRGLNTIKAAIGDQAMALPAITQTLMGDGTMSDLAHSLTNMHRMGIWGQPDLSSTYTIGGAVNDLAKYNEPKSFRGLINDINFLTDHNFGEQGRLNIARGFFAPTPENRAMIDKFNKDFYDPKTQRWVNGADTAFQTMTSPAITHEIMRFKDAKLASDYRNTADAWFNNLFGKDMSNLRDSIQNEFNLNYTSKTYPMKTHIPEIKFTWDSENHELGITPEAKDWLLSQGKRNIVDSLTRLNMGLRNMSNIIETIKGEGYPVDPNAYILDVLRIHGLIDPSVAPVTNQIRDAVTATGKQAKKSSEEIPN